MLLQLLPHLPLPQPLLSAPPHLHPVTTGSETILASSSATCRSNLIALAALMTFVCSTHTHTDTCGCTACILHCHIHIGNRAALLESNLQKSYQHRPHLPRVSSSSLSLWSCCQFATLPHSVALLLWRYFRHRFGLP